MRPEHLRHVLFARRQRLLAVKVERHRQQWSREQIERHQVDQFNAMWSHCLAKIPFYRAWSHEHALPPGISRPTDLLHFPPLDKETIVSRAEEIFQGGAISAAYTTGGSTGRPTRYPRGANDAAAFYANSYLGRSWWGIRPFDESVLLWGHSHLFGTGMRGAALEQRRRLADRALNITRLDAYDLSEGALARNYKALAECDPAYVIGYASAVFQLAKFMRRTQLTLSADRRLRAVVLTAEAFTEADAELIETTFGARVVTEYGTAETGVLAASGESTLPLKVYWDSFICLVGDEGDLAVTTLDRRLFPLVNYVTRDRVKITDPSSRNTLTFGAILGRQQDTVWLANVSGASLPISGILPIHILKGYPGILAIQYRQAPSRPLEILLQADRELILADVATYFAAQLWKDHAAFDPRSVEFIQVPAMVKTIAGKQALFVA